MTHRRDSLLFARKHRAFVVLIVVSALALFYAPVRNALTQAVYTVAPGVWGIGKASSSAWNSFITNFLVKDALVAENDLLRSDVSRMQAQVLDRNLLGEKVNKLEEALGRAQEDNRVVAYVLAGPGLSPYDTLIVDAGTDNGVALGNTVVYAGSGVIGEVVEVTLATSKIKLYSSPGVEHLVGIGGQSIPSRAFGKGMGNFEAKVPEGSAVAPGDAVVSLKSGLLLGIVSSIEGESSLPFVRIFFRVPFNITEIRSVEIVVDKRS
ncbi:MAG: hypothetical protein HZB11_01605 [Candidatus Yonathbacteria bacterium]|nr:hypothetical protein [Candidatus Yonathbacteria bacterium]